jgi:hypothetical protein
MGRRPKEDRGEVKTIVVGVKLTEAERAALDRLVEMRSAEIAEVMGERIEATASGVLRWLLVREAKARGVSVGGNSKPPTPPEPKLPARPRLPSKASSARTPATKGKPTKGRGR